jgi:hypothetical protein
VSDCGACPAFGYDCEYVAKVEAQAAEIKRLREMPSRSTMKAWAKEIGADLRDPELAAARMADRIVAHMTGETE